MPDIDYNNERRSVHPETYRALEAVDAAITGDPAETEDCFNLLKFYVDRWQRELAEYKPEEIGQTEEESEKEVINDDESFDNFLDDATHAVRGMWEDRGGEKLGEEETYALNDLLTAFFQDKRKA